MRIHWTSEAKAQLAGIHSYIAQESPLVAKQVIQRIASRCEQIADLPRSGHKIRDFNRDDIFAAIVAQTTAPDNPFRPGKSPRI